VADDPVALVRVERVVVHPVAVHIRCFVRVGLVVYASPRAGSEDVPAHDVVLAAVLDAVVIVVFRGRSGLSDLVRFE
jgi:hypothetical protein